MLTSMQTFDEAPLTALVTSFEPCAGFSAPGDGSPACSTCGWLDTEHDREPAPVRTLAPRRPAAAAPKRLAS